MFKSWNKKNKIKAVFKLQFHVTQVPKLKKPAVMISLVPEDVGKPSVKLEKVAVQDGTCTWENPVYEPVKLIMETKTGKINEKIYHFIVSTGSSKSGYLGEASIDFADFAAETEPFTVSLPLKFANSGAVLHVTIQRMLGADDGREENGAPMLLKNGSLESQDGTWGTDENNGSFSEDGNILLQKEEYENYHEMTTVEQDAANFLSPFKTKPMLQKGAADASVTNNKIQNRRKLNWSVDSASDDSLLESPSSLEDNNPRERLREASDDSTIKLQNEITILMRQAELSELEIQSLRRHIEKETKQGQNLSRQISSLKEERDQFKLDCEQLRSLQKTTDETEAPKKLQAAIKDLRAQLEAIREELNQEKKLSDNLQLQLQETQDSNSELILVVKDLEDLVERKNNEISDLKRKVENAKTAYQQSQEEYAKRQNEAEEVELLEAKIRGLHSEIETYMEEMEKQNMRIKQITLNYDLLKQDNFDMSLKLKRNQDEQMKRENECADYIATINELESQVERLEETIKKQAREFAEALISINELEGQVKALEKELEQQAKGFEDDMNAIKRAKVEQEQRAIQAEEALKSTRLNNTIKAERLQEEFRSFSLEMSLKVDENEKQATQAETEASELRLQNRILEGKLLKATKELELFKDQEKVKLQELVNKIDLKDKEIGHVSLELNNKSQQLKSAQKHKEEKHEAFLTELQMLRAEIERLNKEKSNVVEEEDEKVRLRDETERMKKAVFEKERLTQRLNKEKENLEAKFALAKQGARKEFKNSHASEQCNMSDLLTEVASLSEKNKSMEKELKEMEGRYSEISLRFAEVEGERQQLVMTVRNLKNGKKN
ncbi:myosin heavy chain, clone 203 [Morus notabilis]|uniref:myosin heavy chain, clone 203 n=1 Tax=Morus notabilis TaxID=981085 RepID=UPI000CED6E2C|nr:myosin heavy chain, clone 203 [Morus notabilis]XP_024028651.1 myosin heavy chain, clone 203 [Morus notabilis]